MLGHELGHALYHKAIVSGSQQSLHFNFSYDEIEKQADDFVAAKLASNESLLAASNVGLGLSEFIHQQYRIFLKEQFPNYDETLVAVRDLPTVVPLA
jgi:Zn-dependent peptidase ImmA (M78 family)